MTEYDMVASSIRKKFIAEVNAKLADGWRLYGSSVVLLGKPPSEDSGTALFYFQPLIRDDADAKDEVADRS
jgi:hypothetical protein